MKYYTLISIILFTSVLLSCYKTEEYPTVPKIEYKSHTLIEHNSYTTINHVISFIDGEGDIGLNEEDTISPYTGLYYNNFIIDYYEKINGEFILIDSIDNYNQRIAPINNLEDKKNTKGEIECQTDVFSAFMKYDTIKLGITLIDRALNKSNTVLTSEIVLN